MQFLGNASWGPGIIQTVHVSLASGAQHGLENVKEAVLHEFLGSEVKKWEGVLSA